MRLWIDGQCLQTASRFRGIGRYVTEFIGGIVEARPDVDIHLSLNAAFAEEAIAARGMLKGLVTPHNIHVWQGVAKSGEGHEGFSERRRISEIALAHHVSLIAPDVALSASPFEGAFDAAVPYFPASNIPQKSAAIFYDAIPLRFPDRYLPSPPAQDYFRRRLQNLSAFDHVLAISGFALSELNALAPGVPGVNIEAAVAPSFRALVNAAEAKAPEASRALSVLYVGGLDWRKNINGAAAAFAHLPDALKAEIRFLVAGFGPAELAEEIRRSWGEARMPEAHLQILGHVDDAQLVDLYRTAGVVIQPSFMEGFGLTALEAMLCGAPVIASRGSALAEVIPDAAATFDPHDGADIADKIARVLTDADFARTLVADGRAHADRYSWARTARIAVETMERFAEASPTDLATARSRARAALGKIGLDGDYTARALAAAEPNRAEGRLIVDVTSTCDDDFGTGIQRVVKKIARQLVVQDAEAGRIELVYGKATDGFHRARSAEDGKITIAAENRAGVALLERDAILMLDSSWTHYRTYAQVLPRALVRGARVISTLYDLVPVRTPAFCDAGMPPVFAAWLQAALAYSTGFVCISRAVAEEFLALLHAIEFPRPMKIGYWTLGADFTSSVTAPLFAPSVAADASFLMVGTIEPRKGHAVALAAFEQLWATGSDVRLTLIGKRGWGMETFIERLIAHPERGRRLNWRERVNDDELAAAYADTSALISSSYAEGFGLPIVEAGHFNKPVMASDLPVFREVARNSPEVRFFTTGDSNALAAAIRDFMGAHAKPVRQGDAEPPFSWAQSAAQLRDLVLNEAWQFEYEPPTVRHDLPRTALGRPAMSKSLDRRAGELTLVDGPLRASDGRIEFIVSAVNKTGFAWSSEGVDETGRLGVVMECRRAGGDGRTPGFAKTETRLPWVMTPEFPHYLRIAVPFGAAAAGNFARIVLRQVGGEEISAPLLVPMDAAGSQAPPPAERAGAVTRATL